MKTEWPTYRTNSRQFAIVTELQSACLLFKVNGKVFEAVIKAVLGTWFFRNVNPIKKLKTH